MVDGVIVEDGLGEEVSGEVGWAIAESRLIDKQAVKLASVNNPVNVPTKYRTGNRTIQELLDQWTILSMACLRN
jgi:hypothetical protein